MRLLVSVRDAGEALLAARAGVHLIDLKEPRDGALGALPLAVVRDVVAALREHSFRQPISATIGDLPMRDPALIVGRVVAVAGCAVDYVKVGVERASGARAVLAALAGCDAPVVPVFIADRGIDFGLVEAACAAPFPAVMLDTVDKGAGSLFERVSRPELAAFIARIREAGKLAALAGSLRAADLNALAQLAPDFAGFRSAVCAAGRGSALDAGRLQALVGAVRHREHNRRQPTQEPL